MIRTICLIIIAFLNFSSAEEAKQCFDKTGCIESACDQIGDFGCNDSYELAKVSEACAQNNGGECLNYVCDQAGSFACNDLSRVSRAARVCRGNYGPECIKLICSKLNDYACDEMYELEKIGAMCAQ